jgi:predicted CXXCH cytochrome family protein
MLIHARVLLWLLISAALLSVTGVCSADYVGAERCATCHQREHDLWRGSHHDLAMTVATEDTVLGNFDNAEFSAHGVTSRFYRKDGDFFVRTDGPDGALHDYPIRYTFGWYPLQQYLIEFPRGHVQSLGLAWDSRPKEEGGQRWFHLYPDEAMNHRHPLHWTQRDQTWNYQCAECHSTNLQKNYDVATDSYQTTFEEIDVACEACHGPGGRHVAWADAVARDPARRDDTDNGLLVDLADRDGAAWLVDVKSGNPRRSEPRTSRKQIELCARCHSRRGQIWSDYEHGKPLGNTHRLSLLEEHLYFPDGQIKDEVYVYGSFIQSRMYQAGVTCGDCHEPHSLQLRAEGNAVCTGCHLPARYDARSHHHHEPGLSGAACVDCHMPQRVYMVNDWRADHSMRVPRPDLSSKLGTPNACNGCHANKTSGWAADAIVQWYPNSARRGPHFGETLHAAAMDAPDAAERLLALTADRSQPGIARATAVDQLRDGAQLQHLSAIKPLLTDDDPLVRAAAVRFLAVTDVRTQVDQGWERLDDPDRVVRLEATRVLAPLLRQRLPDKFREPLTRAVEEYAQAQQVNAERPESHLNLGLIAVAVGDARQAEAAYRTALRLDPAFAPGYVNLSDLYRQQGRDEEGERLLRSGIEAAPADADLQHALGLLLVRQKRLEDALPFLRRATALAPDRSRYAFVYALGLQGAGDVSQALEVLAEANARQPGNREILKALVSMHRERGDTEQAQRYADELARRFP